MKKVLYVLNYMNIGGTEKAFLNLVDTLPPEEYDITLLLLEKKGGFLDQVPERVHIITLDNYLPDIKSEIMDPPLSVCGRYLKKGKVLSAAGLFLSHLLFKATGNRTSFYRFVLRKNTEMRGFDEYHAYAGPFDFISALVAFKCRGGKKIQWIHFDVSKFQFNKKTCGTVYRRFDEFRAVSNEALDSLLKVMPRIKGKAITCPNIVSRDVCRRLAEEGQGFCDDYDGIRIVTLGRLSEEKGQDIIPEIAARLKSYGHSFRWYLIGDGKLRDIIIEKAKHLGCENEICLLGTQANPYPFLKDADIYVQTSVHEGFCLALSEARALSLPVVSTVFAGAHEQLDGFDDCRVVLRSTEAICSAIDDIINKKR